MTWIEERLACRTERVYEEMVKLIRENVEEMNLQKQDGKLAHIPAFVSLPPNAVFHCEVQGPHLQVQIRLGEGVMADLFSMSVSGKSLTARGGYTDQQREESRMQITPQWVKHEGKCFLEVTRGNDRSMVDCVNLDRVVQEALEPAFFPEGEA